jgi:hypothetical protein
LRRSAALCLLVFVGATLVVSHSHKNPIADLITDGPSDSGIFVLASHLSAGALSYSSGRLVVDDPCLACFWHDVTATAAVFVALLIISTPLAALSLGASPNPLGARLPPRCSRGPPHLPL